MRKFALIFVLILVAPLCFFGCKKKSENLNFYVIDATFNENRHTLTCHQEVTYYNKSSNLLDKVMFHLYPNAFRQNAKASVVSPLHHELAYPNGDSYGGVEILSVSNENKVASYSVCGSDENILAVNLFDQIYPGEKTKISIEYVVTIPNINHRFGYGENAINCGNFFPIACVYEDGVGFKQDLYHFNGDPFYSDVANFQVSIIYPENYLLASTGITGETVKTGEGVKSCVKASKVRDFAFVLSKNFSLNKFKAGSIDVSYYFYDDENAKRSQKVIIDSMKTFESLYGKYPYSTLAVVQTNFLHGGMEYPNLVMISDALSSHEEYEYVIVHELAHQWWYGVVGNNEYENAWLDEGLTEYSTMLFYKENEDYGQDYDDLLTSATNSYKLFKDVYSRVGGDVDTSMNRRLDEFETEPEYSSCVYTKSVLMLDSLKQLVGERKFLKAMAHYYKKFSFKNARPEDFIACFIESTGYDLESFFVSWIEGYVVIL